MKKSNAFYVENANTIKRMLFFCASNIFSLHIFIILHLMYCVLRNAPHIQSCWHL
jgi:hypothetical protein